MARSKRGEGLVCLGVYISESDHSQLKQLAEQKKDRLGVRVTISDEVRAAIKEYLAHTGKKK